ncbi:KTSC domain-containing protein [Erythrobacter sp. YJ-T3-07]|uniref:KTSC domain-containing protein n=1 Tax=Erythrobacter sp. YJ-T3-07 TaxID=2793063 RepID=UPI0018D3CB98|nr:KTSC domain-containing protein [Erythrobacter sp. YJ-T3-07]
MPYFPESRAIKRAEYEPSTQRLTIWFPRGKPYDYCGVPNRVWEGLLAAGSKGTYFNDHIADRYHC